MPKGACRGSDSTLTSTVAVLRSLPIARGFFISPGSPPALPEPSEGRTIHPTEVAMPTPRKVAMLAEIQDRMSRASIAISADYRGLTVAQITELRRALRPSGAEVKVVKNTLAGM